MGVKLRFERPFVRDNTNRIVANESELVQQADLIATKVSQTDFNGNTISSLINQTATTIKIQAQKIQLEGLVTANNNFKVLLDGSIEAVNGKFSGNINGGTINIGSKFSVDASGNLVASNAVLSGSITSTRVVAPSNQNAFLEIGNTGGAWGMSLYDLTYGSNPYFKILELEGNAFSINDYNDRMRIIVSSQQTSLRDYNNITRLSILDSISSLRSPSGNTYISITDNLVRVVKNGVTVASW